MSLEDDIARVAKLRGRSAADIRAVQVRAAKAEEEREARYQGFLAREKETSLANLHVSMDGSVKDQMDAYDRLPKRSREFLREHTPQISARRWLDALEQYNGDEEKLIAAVVARDAQQAYR